MGPVTGFANLNKPIQGMLRLPADQIEPPLNPFNPQVHPVNPVRQTGILHRQSADLRFDMPYYRRELAIVLRRLADGVVVFESRARHDGLWHDDEAVLPAMLQAALQGFPTPPPGQRRVVVEIPR